MSIAEKIAQDLTGLPESAQAEVLGFVEFLKSKAAAAEEGDWSDFSLTQALHGMENEPNLYSEHDLKEVFA